MTWKKIETKYYFRRTLNLRYVTGPMEALKTSGVAFTFDSKNSQKLERQPILNLSKTGGAAAPSALLVLLAL